MIEVKENVDLFSFNTFHIPATCRYLVTLRTEEDARKVFEDGLFRSHRHLILGGGSNVLLTGDFDGVVVKNELAGVDIVEEDDDMVHATLPRSLQAMRPRIIHCRTAKGENQDGKNNEARGKRASSFTRVESLRLRGSALRRCFGRGRILIDERTTTSLRHVFAHEGAD